MLTSIETEHLRIELIRSEDIYHYLDDIAVWRMHFFREYPYLYEGSAVYERQYLENYANSNGAYLAAAYTHEGELAGLATMVPLCSEHHILHDAEELFMRQQLDPADFYYIGEVLVSPKKRGQGVAKALLATLEETAQMHGYNGICMLTVVRAANHPMRPHNYQDNDKIWSKLGYRKSPLFTTFEWPTFQPDGRTLNALNPMVFWLKLFVH